MMGKGKSSGVINEASNLLANQNLTKATEQMLTKEYQKSRDMDDVIPTHKHMLEKGTRRDENAGLRVYNPDEERAQDRLERQVDDDEDDELSFLRERRMAAMKKEQGKMAEWLAKQHGSYREIRESDFFSTVVREKGGSDDVALHFYHKDFEKCKIMDRRLGELAPDLLSVKFVKIDVESSPFLVERLKVTVLPCVVLFRNDIATDRIVGFEDMGVEDIDPVMLRARILQGLKMDGEAN